MFSRVWTHACALLILISLLFGGAGCGSSSKARAIVKGRVTIGGKPLYAGTVAFLTADQRTGSATIDQNGNYNMSDAPIGDVKITVSVPKSGMAAMMGSKGAPKPPPGVGEMKDPNNPSQGSSTPALDPNKIVPIPDKYADAETSGLTYKVEKGEQTHNIELKP